MTFCPLMSNVGVEVMPCAIDSSYSARTSSAYVSLSSASVNRSTSNPSSAAIAIRRFLLNAPSFSPDWLA
jgi:hypothetical protein